MPYKPTGRPPGRPRKTATPIALARLASGEAATAAEAAEGLDIAPSTVSRHAAAAELAPPVARPLAKTAPKVAAPTIALDGVELPAWFEPALRDLIAAFVVPTVAQEAPVERLRAYAAHDAAALAVLEQLLVPPAALSADLGSTAREMLTELWGDYRHALGTSKRNPAAGRILDALRELRQHFPPPAPAAPPDAVMAKLDELEGAVLKRIFEHAAEPITAAELAAGVADA